MAAYTVKFSVIQPLQCWRNSQSQNQPLAKAGMDIVSPIIGGSAVGTVAMAVCRMASAGQHDTPFGCHFAKRTAGRSTPSDPLEKAPVIVR
jgi:hypothetical protein